MVISHDPYTDTFKLHFSHGRVVILEREQMELHSRLCQDVLKPWCFEDKGELVNEYA